MIGATNPDDAAPGTFRGDFAVGRNKSSNIIHGSDSDGSAAREIGIWFKPEEIVTWPNTTEPWIYENTLSVLQKEPESILDKIKKPEPAAE